MRREREIEVKQVGLRRNKAFCYFDKIKLIAYKATDFVILLSIGISCYTSVCLGSETHCASNRTIHAKQTHYLKPPHCQNMGFGAATLL